MRAAILGVGRMGRRHIEVVRKLGLQLVGLFDVSKDSLKAAHEEHAVGTELLFNDLDSFYSQAKPECLIIATTADSHCALTCMAAERGVRFVLVEKPMAVSLAQCDKMIQTCARFGTRLAVNHQMRFMQQYIEPKGLSRTAAYGKLSSMTVVAGNFGLAMNGSHYFEAFRFLTDEDVTEVAAWFSPESVPNPRGAQFVDRAGCVRCVTSSGIRLYIEASADQGHGVRVVYACLHGMITIDELSGELFAIEREQQYRSLPTTRYGMPAIATHRSIQPAEVINVSAAVLDALLQNQDSVTGEDGRRVMELLVAAHESGERGGATVRLSDGLDHVRVYPWA